MEIQGDPVPTERRKPIWFDCSFVWWTLLKSHFCCVHRCTGTQTCFSAVQFLPVKHSKTLSQVCMDFIAAYLATAFCIMCIVKVDDSMVWKTFCHWLLLTSVCPLFRSHSGMFLAVSLRVGCGDICGTVPCKFVLQQFNSPHDLWLCMWKYLSAGGLAHPQGRSRELVLARLRDF